VGAFKVSEREYCIFTTFSTVPKSQKRPDTIVSYYYPHVTYSVEYSWPAYKQRKGKMTKEDNLFHIIATQNWRTD